MPLPNVSDHLVTSTQALRSLCLELLYVLWGVPFLHAPFRQRVVLGLGPMRGQGTKARRAAGRNGTPELGGKRLK